ncbi:lanthionine synthetase LanC family protein [Nonomuraea sp. NPDC005650]|uniref:lanthionine synthetase LanC family protein n=1 Tax=Nonomuraea sp. NPDC005650 TaxID=3157045 RepID=UPI0033A74ED1
MAARLARPESLSPAPDRWPDSLARGKLGLVPLYAALDGLAPNSEWDVSGHHILKDGTFTGPGGTAGLFSGGLAGFGVAAALMGRRAGRYGKVLGRLDAAVGPVAGHDLIDGTAGAGVYLLMRSPSAGLEAVARELARGASACPPFPMRRIPPGWSVGDGYADCGLAHGVAGPLAVLSLLSGHAEEIARPAVETLAEWLLGAAVRDQWGTAWPAGVDGAQAYPSPRRASWCYGVPGVARALWLAGEALDEPRYRRAARDAMAELLDAPDGWGLDSLGVCHGLAGLMLMTATFVTGATGDELGAAGDGFGAAGDGFGAAGDGFGAAGDGFGAAVELLFDRVCAAYDSRLPLGFDVAGPGLLNGAAGIALALLAVTGGLETASMFLAA